MPTSKNNCGQCNKLIRSDIRIIKCDTCDNYFQVKCCGINHKTFNAFKCTGGDWICKKCVHTNDNEVRNTSAVITNPELTCKCGKCKKNIPPHLRDIICDFCKTYYHVQCLGISKATF